MANERIEIKGLAQLSRALRKMDSEAPKGLRLVQNDAANLIVDKTRPLIPHRTGAAAKSLKAKSSRTLTRIAVGGNRARYYPWLDFGGKTGINRSVDRPFYKEGRYLYPTLGKNKAEIADLLQKGILAVAQSAGLDVD
jgi:hypothetical protein